MEDGTITVSAALLGFFLLALVAAAVSWLRLWRQVDRALKRDVFRLDHSEGRSLSMAAVFTGSACVLGALLVIFRHML